MGKKIGLILDSGASLYKNELKNVEVIPLIINEIVDKRIDTYNDGVDLSREDVYKKILNKSKLSTSQSVFGECYNLVQKMLKKYDEVMVFPLSKGLSGTYNTWIQVASEFDSNKVHIFDNCDVATGIYFAMIDSYEKYLNGESISDIHKFLEERNTKREAVVIINDLDHLVRGGRLSVVKSKIAKLLGLRVLVKFNGKLDLLDKTKTIPNAIDKSLKSMDENIHFCSNGIKRILITTNYMDFNDPAVLEYKKHLENWLNKNGVDYSEIIIDYLPSVISIHTGINTIGVWIEAK
ncbi:MAG: DegV family protein [Mycoplasmoidaceae bacterium]